MDIEKIPNHIAIIVDGNRRWAKEHNKTPMQGHDEGLKNLKSISDYILSKGVKYLSLFVFSTENFKRDEKEVKHLMKLFTNTFKKEKNYFLEKNIKVIFSGKKENLSKEVINSINETELCTKDCTKGICNICLNYGGQSEIVDAVNKILKDNKKEITIEDFNNYLYQNIPPIDLMIRTSGEYRISNFMLWQLAYSELYFINKNFPDFKEEDLDKALLEFSKRDRRFGKR